MVGKEFKDPVELAYAGLSKEAKAQWDHIDNAAAIARQVHLECHKERIEKGFPDLYAKVKAEHSGHVFNHNPPGASSAKTPKELVDATYRRFDNMKAREEKIINDFVEFSRSQIIAQDRSRGGPQPESKRVADQFAFYVGQASEAQGQGQPAETKPTPVLYSPDQPVDTSHIDRSGHDRDGSEGPGQDGPEQGGPDDGHGL